MFSVFLFVGSTDKGLSSFFLRSSCIATGGDHIGTSCRCNEDASKENLHFDDCVKLVFVFLNYYE